MKMLAIAMAGAVTWTCVAGDSEGSVVFDAPAPAQFAEVGGTAKSVSYRTIPSSWIVDDWHRLGVKVYALLTPEEDESPELYRRRAGFLAFRSGVDGVRWGGGEDDRAYFAPALAAADDDRALVGTLDRLAVRAMGSDDATLRLAGRQARIYLHVSADFSSAPSALIRRELALRMRALQKLLGEPPLALSADIPDAQPRRITLPKATHEVEGPTAYKTVQLFPDLKMVNRGFGFDLVVLGDRPLKAGEWPGVRRDYTLYIPGTNRTDWLVYKLSCDLTARKDVVMAAPRVQFYTFQPRFHAVDEPRYRVRSLYLPSRSRPLLVDGPRDVSPKSCAGEGGGNWQFRFTFCWERLEGFYPQARSAWYLSQGNETVKIVWRNRLDCFQGIEFRHVVADYEKECEKMLSDWRFADPLFCAVGVQPLADANNELVAMLNKKIQPNGYISWTPSDKFILEKAAANFNRVRYFKEDVEAARIRYLDDILAGREVKVPVRKKIVEEKKPKGPSIDDDEGGISLDDTEY